MRWEKRDKELQPIRHSGSVFVRWEGEDYSDRVMVDTDSSGHCRRRPGEAGLYIAGHDKRSSKGNFPQEVVHQQGINYGCLVDDDRELLDRGLELLTACVCPGALRVNFEVL